MSDCFFCGDFVGDETGDGGAKGRTVGNRDICEQCLAELKFWLQGTLAKAPSMREKPIKEEQESSREIEEAPEEKLEEQDPFKAMPTD